MDENDAAEDEVDDGGDDDEDDAAAAGNGRDHRQRQIRHRRHQDCLCLMRLAWYFCSILRNLAECSPYLFLLLDREPRHERACLITVLCDWIAVVVFVDDCGRYYSCCLRS